MKCLSARIGEGFHDLDGIRYLLRYLNVANAAEASAIIERDHRARSSSAIIERYYPLGRIPQKTLYLLEELLPRAQGFGARRGSYIPRKRPW
jgi:hypothetical protein